MLVVQHRPGRRYATSRGTIFIKSGKLDVTLIRYQNFNENPASGRRPKPEDFGVQDMLQECRLAILQRLSSQEIRMVQDYTEHTGQGWLIRSRIIWRMLLIPENVEERKSKCENC